jgi:hypothetical protein
LGEVLRDSVCNDIPKVFRDHRLVDARHLEGKSPSHVAALAQPRVPLGARVSSDCASNESMPRYTPMKFLYTDLGPRQAGEVVEVRLSAVANVRLMDTPNFGNYKAGVKHIYTGGVVRQSPIRLAIPTSGHWHVAIDTTGIQGTPGVSAVVKVVPA